jgi:MOB kinase activator 1
MTAAVKCPPGEDQGEWISINCVDFFNEVNLLYGTVFDSCTAESCPQMCAGTDYKYLWADGVKVKKPIALCARDYVENLMTWAEGELSDEFVWSAHSSGKMKRLKKLYQRFFRVYAHIYHHHFTQLQSLGAEAHLNTCFKHFLFFVLEYKLIKPQELAPLNQLINRFTAEEQKLIQTQNDQ